MTGAEIMGVVAFFFMVSGALWAIWWRIEGKVDKAKAEASNVASAANALASLTRQELAEHKLHCAEVFATKQGMQEQAAQIMRALESIGGRIDGMNERLDRAFERQPSTRRAS